VSASLGCEKHPDRFADYFDVSVRDVMPIGIVTFLCLNAEYKFPHLLRLFVVYVIGIITG